jgi:hypothetical protein
MEIYFHSPTCLYGIHRDLPFTVPIYFLLSTTEMQLSHPEDKGSMFFYIYIVKKPQKEHHVRN